MKKFIALFSFITALTSCSSAQHITQIDQKLDAKDTREIVLEKVINDSRCPEGVQCIWAGEVTIAVAVYDHQKLIEQTQLTLNPHNQEEIIAWFAKRLPKTKKALQSVVVTPGPSQKKPLDKKDYKIELGY
ncbi:hypothetical protein [Flavobacterium sp.]|uniref:hypothetical protein n=1 Tax=Flavobacterium sp. TaxID=239 RepID=UPI003D133D49